MIIYRLEVNNKGIYRHSATNNSDLKDLIFMMAIDHGGDDYPSLKEDFNYHPDLFCAVASPESLRSWFGNYLNKFSKFSEVNVVKLKVKDFITGKSGKQVAFYWKDVISKEKLDLREFLKSHDVV